VVTAPARRQLVRQIISHGLSERRALRVVRMSASALRYESAPDSNMSLRERILTLAHRHRRYGAGMIYLKLRQAGLVINHKRVERLYALAKLQVRRRKRKKVPVSERQPLVRPQGANEVWSMDFVFDRTAEGRVIKCLTIVDDATHESIAIVPERAIGGHPLTRILDQLRLTRGLPKVIRTDNGKEFCGKAMLTWAYERGVALRLIEPGKPNQNAYIESFNGRPTRRMLERTLVHQFGPRPRRDRSVATRIQRGTTEESTRRADARCLCCTTGCESGYDDTRTLKPTATQGGVTSLALSDVLEQHIDALWSGFMRPQRHQF
jgi:putative transposase